MIRLDELGSKPVKQLLFEQASPAAIGILVLSIYGIVDTIFVGRWVGTVAIAAITVVIPIIFLIASIGMAIGVGGASIISRSLGAGNPEKGYLTFGNQILLTLILSTFFVLVGSVLQDPFLKLFGGKGEILPVAKTYFSILLPGIPFLAFAMMSNNVIRAEGQAKMAMYIMLIPAVVNMILDPIFIIWLDMGISGAALATTIAYVSSAGYALWYFVSGRSELRPRFKVNMPIIQEILSLGLVTFARQGTVSLLFIVLNNTLHAYGGTLAVSVLGIVHRFSMFAFFPILGITQGFLPIAGYNYGAKNWDRVLEGIKVSLKYGVSIASGLLLILVFFSDKIAGIFTTDEALIMQSGPALLIAFGAAPLAIFHLISSAYFQALGRARPALVLAMLKQGILMIPLLLVLPKFYGVNGVWYSFPIAEVLAAAIGYSYLRYRLNPYLKQRRKN